jgi:hypothetical protein
VSAGLFDGIDAPVRPAAAAPASLDKPEACGCGAPHPSFGFGVSLLRGRIGRWSCADEACRARAEKGERG